MSGTTTGRDLDSEIAFLTRALKAPTLREAVGRLAERARTESWSHEEFLIACLQREVAARESHGGEGRIRAARFPARKSLEEFNFVSRRSPWWQFACPYLRAAVRPCGPPPPEPGRA
jgi:DNA replication protein DnaC